MEQKRKFRETQMHVDPGLNPQPEKARYWEKW